MSKKVKCFDCGYLCLENTSQIFQGDRTIIPPDPLRGNSGFISHEYDTRINYLEITPQVRKDIARLKEDAKNVYCYRHSYLLSEEINVKSGEELSVQVKSVIEKSRECKYHVNYISGYNAEQHLMKWENEQREKSNRIWNFIYLIIGAIITIIVTAVINHYQTN